MHLQQRRAESCSIELASLCSRKGGIDVSWKRTALKAFQRGPQHEKDRNLLEWVQKRHKNGQRDGTPVKGP